MSEVGMIEVTGVDLRDMLRAAYRLSSPQGLGFLHADETDAALKEFRAALSALEPKP